MGFSLEIGGVTYPEVGFSVTESATPLAGGDSSGSAGSTSVVIPTPDPNIGPEKSLLSKLGPFGLHGEVVRLWDGTKGFVEGEVESTTLSLPGASTSLEVKSLLGSLNVYNLQMPPVTGTLSYAILVYLLLGANISSGYYVDPEIRDRPVAYPGWGGELWYHMKLMAAAQDIDITVIDGVITFQPIRKYEAVQRSVTQSSVSAGGGQLAEYVEVIQNNNYPVSGELVYPPGGWTEEVPVISVNSGEYIEVELALESSLLTIIQPTMVEFVGRDHDSSSVFTVVGDDGFPIKPSAWKARGGSLRVEINSDTHSLTVKIKAPTGIYNDTGSEISSYSIGLASDTGTGQYSTLRIIGYGVAYQPESRMFPTGIESSQTATCIGETVENPFLSTAEEATRVGLRAVKNFNGTAIDLSGAGPTLTRYKDLNLNERPPVFGTTAGARIWDKTSRRWFRIRDATMTPGMVSYEAEDDLLGSDINHMFQGKTVGEVQAAFNGLTYRQIQMMGVRDEL